MRRKMLSQLPGRSKLLCQFSERNPAVSFVKHNIETPHKGISENPEVLVSRGQAGSTLLLTPPVYLFDDVKLGVDGVSGSINSENKVWLIMKI